MLITMSTALLISLGAIVGASVGNSAIDRHGSICLAPVRDDATSIDAETANRRGYVSYEFSVRIDDGDWVALPTEKPRRLSGFALDRKHLVRIRDGERLIESFWFTFDGRGGPELCLSYKSWYQTWLLEEPFDRPWCQCERED